jgi:hypothetical protein
MVYDNDGPIYSMLNGKPCTDYIDCEHLCLYYGEGQLYGYMCAGRGTGTGDYPWCCPLTMNGREFYQTYSSGTCNGGVCGDTPYNPFPPVPS